MKWYQTNRADPRAAALADKHYSRQAPGTRQFTPPGRVLVLVTADYDAVWASSWPYAAYVNREIAPGAWTCTLFRREPACPHLASALIREAVAATCWYWGEPPTEGMVTMVDKRRVRGKRHFGLCYRHAGFAEAGYTKGGLLVLQLRPDAMPEAQPARQWQASLWELPAPRQRVLAERGGGAGGGRHDGGAAGVAGGGGMMRVLSLYSGVGGLDLAAESAGFTPVAFCECEPFCRRVLAHHWPHVPIYERDEDVTAERLRRDGILGPVADSTGRGHAVESQVTGREPAVVGAVAGSGGGVSERGTTPRVSQHGRTDAAGTPHLRETDDLIIIGGPPCQPSSAAGKRLGTADSRWRWPEALRIVREVKPRWVCFENPVGIRTVESGRAFGAILGELAALGYRVGYDQWAAADVGAPHRRERVFIVGRRMADADRLRGLQPQGCVAHIGGRTGNGGAAGVEHAAVGDGVDVCRGRRNVRGAGQGNARDAGAAGGSGDLADAGRGRRQDDHVPAGWDAARGCGEGQALTACDGRQQGRPEPAGQQGRCDAAERGTTVADTEQRRRDGRQGVQGHQLDGCVAGRDETQPLTGACGETRGDGLAVTQESRLSNVIGAGRRIAPRQSRPQCRRQGGGAFRGATQPCVGEPTARLPRWLAGRWPARPGEPQAEWEAPRLARGVPERVAKLRALGNAVVPAQAAPIFAAIAEIEVAV